jgi:phosphopantothenoylcysteine synthetase/decarboxylase
MKILITGGHTEIPIDQVRSITNIFKGRTACDLAKWFYGGNHEVSLFGNKNMDDALVGNISYFDEYRTYDELYKLMRSFINQEVKDYFDVIIHSAAVSDYKVEAVMMEVEHNHLVEVDNSAKISSDHENLYLKLVKTEKIIDKIREWGFVGTLVKFKLQVGISDEELIQIAEKSRVSSGADIIVANCLEWAKERAIILWDGGMEKVLRKDLGYELEKVIKKV